MGILNRKKLVARAQVTVGGVVGQAGILDCVLSVCRGGSRPASAGTSPTGTMYLPGRWTAYRAYSKKVSTHTQRTHCGVYTGWSSIGEERGASSTAARERGQGLVAP